MNALDGKRKIALNIHHGRNGAKQTFDFRLGKAWNNDIVLVAANQWNYQLCNYSTEADNNRNRSWSKPTLV